MPAFGNVEVAEAVTLAGGLPVFADIDPVTYCLDASAVEAAVTPRTAAIVVVHRFGRSADVARLLGVGQRHGLLVLQQGESEAPYDEVAQRRERAAYLDAKLRGCGRPMVGTGTPISSTSCGCRGTGGRIGTPSLGPCAAGELSAGCR